MTRYGFCTVTEHWNSVDPRFHWEYFFGPLNCGINFLVTDNRTKSNFTISPGSANRTVQSGREREIVPDILERD